MRAVWLLSVALAVAGCSHMGMPGASGVPDDLRDAPAAQVYPTSAGEALYLRLVSRDPEDAAESVLGLSSEDRDLLASHIVATKGREDLWTARFEVDPALPARESAFICWYLGGFSHYATLGRR